MDWIENFIDQAFGDYRLMFIDVFTFAGVDSHQIINDKAVIYTSGGAEDILKVFDTIGLFVEYEGVHHWRTSYCL